MTIFGVTAPTGQSEYYVRSRLFTRDFLLEGQDSSASEDKSLCVWCAVFGISQDTTHNTIKTVNVILMCGVSTDKKSVEIYKIFMCVAGLSFNGIKSEHSSCRIKPNLQARLGGSVYQSNLLIR